MEYGKSAYICLSFQITCTMFGLGRRCHRQFAKSSSTFRRFKTCMDLVLYSFQRSILLLKGYFEAIVGTLNKVAFEIKLCPCQFIRLKSIQFILVTLSYHFFIKTACISKSHWRTALSAVTRSDEFVPIASFRSSNPSLLLVPLFMSVVLSIAGDQCVELGELIIVKDE